jgi:hypothetical protein
MQIYWYCVTCWLTVVGGLSVYIRVHLCGTGDWSHIYRVSESCRQMTLLVVVQAWQVNQYGGAAVHTVSCGRPFSNMVLACGKWHSENEPEFVSGGREREPKKQICCWRNELVTQGVVLLHDKSTQVVGVQSVGSPRGRPIAPNWQSLISIPLDP